MNEMENLNASQIRDFIIVLLALAGAIVLIGNAIKMFKEWRKPSEDLSEWKTKVDQKLDNDNKRLTAIEEANKVVTRGLLALISHELNGNSNDKLIASQTEITNYLIER